MIEIEIDGKKLEVTPGSMIIEVADNAGIAIPRFCYHKKLTVAANCRMCLVEVEKVGKPLPACATPVTAGMKISTKSSKAIDAQRSVMEFLLINHPLDCPICDQGGECELQDISLGYGPDISRYSETKRVVKDKDIGPLIATDMTRCIQCTRCVRFGTAVAGIREMGAYNRGENLEIGTYIERSLVSEMSGNIIDLCPVGALTSKPFRFTARAWELIQQASIAPHDCIGSHIYIHTRRDQVMRVVPNECETINETWISDRDRYSYTGIYNHDRLTVPMIKRGGHWEETDWTTALEFTATKIRDLIHQYGAKQIAALASPSATTEEFYLLQKLMRALGSSHIDHRLHQTDVSDQAEAPLFPGLEISIEELQNQEVVLLIGSNIQREQPIAGHRLRKATLQGAKVFCIHSIDHEFNFSVTEKCIIPPSDFVHTMAEIAHALSLTSKQTISANLPEYLTQMAISEKARAIAEQLQSGQRKVIILGALVQNHPQAAALHILAQLIASLSGAQLGYLTEGSNAVGAWLAGAVPHRNAAGVPITMVGFNAYAALQAQLKAYVLFNVEPECDCADPALAMQALSQAELLISFSTFKSPILMQNADILLPIASYAETAGTYVNAEGRWQSFVAATSCVGEARPGWKVMRVLANLLSLPGFDYISAESICAELQNKVTSILTDKNTQPNWQLIAEPWPAATGLQRITEWPMYRIDALVRRAEPLQKAAANIIPALYLNRKTAAQSGLSVAATASAKQGENAVILPVVLDEKIPDNCVFIPAGFPETAGLGASFGAIEIGVAHA